MSWVSIQGLEKYIAQKRNFRKFVRKNKENEDFFKKAKDDESRKKDEYLDAHYAGKSKYIHGKRNTMKIFYCRRGETFSFNSKSSVINRIEIYTSFIEKMSYSKENRQLDDYVFTGLWYYYCHYNFFALIILDKCRTAILGS